MSSEWFRSFVSGGEQPGDGGAVRLVCFPHAGGAASAFVALSRVLAPAVDVVAVQYPGRQDRRLVEPVADIGLLADALAEEVREHVAPPYAFFGHSMGAVLAYETASRLAERGVTGPVRLFLSGRGAPGGAPGLHDRFRTDADVLAAVRRLGGTASAVFDNPEILEMVMPTLRADYRAIGSYTWTPRPSLSVPFTVLVGDSDPVVEVAEASAWDGFTTGGTDLNVFPGGHFYLDAQVREVAATIAAALGRSGPAGAVPGA